MIVRVLVVSTAWLLSATPAPALAQNAPDLPPPAQPAEPQPGPEPAKKRANQPTPAGRPYESLVKRDAERRVIPLQEPVTWAAIRRNPTITKEDWVRLEPVMLARKAECESIVLRNLDIVESIEDGALEKIQGDTRQVLKSSGDLVRPLKPSGGDFCVKLGTDRVLTQAQTRVSQKLASDYNKALAEQYQASAKRGETPGEKGTAAVIRRMQLLPIDETIWTYRMLLDEASRSLDRTLPTLKWSAETLAKIEPQRAALAAASDDAARAASMRTLMDTLTPDQRRALLTATIDTREKK